MSATYFDSLPYTLNSEEPLQMKQIRAIGALLCVFAAVNLSANVEETSTASVESISTQSASKTHFRIGTVNASPLVKVLLPGENIDLLDDTLRSQVGVKIGVGLIAPRAFGYTVNLAHVELSRYTHHQRLDGNVAYGFSKNFFMFGGLNFSKTTFNGSRLKSKTPGMGSQFGLGGQFGKNLSIELAFVRSNNRAGFKSNSFYYGEMESRIELEGPEFSIMGAF